MYCRKCGKSNEESARFCAGCGHALGQPRTQAPAGGGGGGGGVAIVVVVLAVVFGGIALVSILAAIAIPAYQDYTVRAQVSEAVVVGGIAKVPVEEFWYRHQRIPHSLEEAGVSPVPTASVRSVEIDPDSGIVVVTMAAGPVEGDSLLLVPELQEDGAIAWTCMSADIDDRHLPAQCK